MRTPLAIGIGIACFALGGLTASWIGGGAKPDEGNGAEGWELTAMDRKRGSEVRSGGIREPARLIRNGIAPTLDEVLELIDPIDELGSRRRLEERLLGLDAEGFTSLLARIEVDVPEPGRWQAIQFISEQFGRGDPRAALEFACDPKNFRASGSALESAVKTLIRESPEIALESVRGVGDPRMKKTAMRQLMFSLSASEPVTLLGWMDQDEIRKIVLSSEGWANELVKNLATVSPEKAATFALELPKAMIGSGITSVAQAWAQRDPAAALAWVRSLDDESMRRSAIQKMIGEIAQRSPEDALSLLESSKSGDREALISSIAGGFSYRDPRPALDWAATLEDPKELSKALRSLELGLHSETDVEDYIALLDRLPVKDRKDPGGRFFSGWMSLEPERATAWLGSLEDPKLLAAYLDGSLNGFSHNDPEKAIKILSQFADSIDPGNWHVQNAFTNLAKSDPEAARVAAEGLKEGKLKTKAMHAVLGDWASHEPEAAAAYVFENYEEGTQQRNMLDGVAATWIERDQDQALAWARELEATQRVAASNQMIAKMAWGDSPDRARAELAALVEANPEEASKSGRLTIALGAVMNKAGEDDPQAGIAIINQLTTEQAQREAIRPLVGSWANSEPEEARQWVSQLESGPLRDTAAKSVARRSVTKDSAGAFEMALSIGGERDRAETLEFVVEHWSAGDTKAAKSAIESADLSNVERQNLLDRVE